MTPDERRKPELINGSRRSRIAKGSGVDTADVNNLLKQFKQVQQMMKGDGPGQGRQEGQGGACKGPKLPGLPGRDASGFAAGLGGIAAGRPRSRLPVDSPAVSARPTASFPIRSCCWPSRSA